MNVFPLGDKQWVISDNLVRKGNSHVYLLNNTVPSLPAQRIISPTPADKRKHGYSAIIRANLHLRYIFRSHTSRMKLQVRRNIIHLTT